MVVGKGEYFVNMIHLQNDKQQDGGSTNVTLYLLGSPSRCVNINWT
jgi:hypothetical protein